MKKVSLIMLMSSVVAFAAGAQTPEQLAQIRAQQQAQLDALNLFNRQRGVSQQGMPGGSPQGTMQQPGQVPGEPNPGGQVLPQVGVGSPQGNQSQNFQIQQGGVPQTESTQPASQSGVVSPQQAQPLITQNPQISSQQGVALQQEAQPQAQNPQISQGAQGNWNLVKQSVVGVPQGNLPPPPPPLPESIANMDGGMTPSGESAVPDVVQAGGPAPVAVSETSFAEPAQEQQIQSSQQFGDRSEKKCAAVCSKYTQYYYVSLITSVCGKKTFLGKMIEGELNKLSPEMKQCSLESLLPEFNGPNNKGYKSQVIFPGSLTTQEFYTTCYTECYKGPGDKIFSPTNPILVKLGQFYDTTRDNKHDPAFSAILLGGDDAFSTDAAASGSIAAPAPNATIPQG